jgi:hypothetical protein
VVYTLTRHSSGSLGWSEMRWLEKRSRRNLLDFSAQSVEHQVARRTEHTANVRDLKTLALHLQVTNDRNRGVTELSATIGNDPLGNFIFRLRRVNYVSTKTSQAFVGYCGRVDRRSEIVHTSHMKISAG